MSRQAQSLHEDAQRDVRRWWYAWGALWINIAWLLANPEVEAQARRRHGYLPLAT